MTRLTYPTSFPAAGSAVWSPTSKQAYRGGGGAPVPPVAVPDAAPTLLVAIEGTNALEVDLMWQDNSSDETGFKIQRGTDGVIFATIATTAADVEVYTDTVPEAGVWYYQVRATNAGGDTDPTNIEQVSVGIPDETFHRLLQNADKRETQLDESLRLLQDGESSGGPVDPLVIEADFATDKALPAGWVHTRSTSASYYDAAGFRVPYGTLAADAPAFTHDPDTLKSLGIQDEGPTTQLMLHSGDWNQSEWAKSAGFSAIKDQTGPDNLANSASRLTITANFEKTNQTKSITPVFDGFYTASYDVQLGTASGTDNHTGFRIRLLGGSGVVDGLITINNITGAVTYNPNGVVVRTQALKNSFTRFFLTIQGNGNNNQAEFGIYPVQSQTGYGAGTGTCIFAEIMLEQRDRGSSHITSTTAEVTRGGVLLNDDAEVGLVNQTAGKIVIHGRTPDADAVAVLAEISDGGATDRIRANSQAGVMAFTSANSGGNDASASQTGPADDTDFGLAMTWEQDKAVMSVDGTSGTEDNICDFPLGDAFTNLDFGTNVGGALPYYGTIALIQIYDAAGSDAQRDIDSTPT